MQGLLPSEIRVRTHRVYREVQAMALRSGIEFSIDPDDIVVDVQDGRRAPLWVHIDHHRSNHVCDQDAAWVILARFVNGGLGVAE